MEQADLDAMKEKVMEREGEMNATEDNLYAASSPVAVDMFHKKALNALVKATNKLLPLFGVSQAYAALPEDIKTLPTDFVRILSMFSSAISDAIAADTIEPDMAFSLEDITDDTGLVQAAGKIGMVSGEKAFKAFLKAPRKEPAAEEATDASVPEMAGGMDMSEGMDSEELFMGRV
jgi:hypothetical protein